jgi:adenosine deaminase
LFDESKITGKRVTDPSSYVERLAQFVADKRITIEVCLTSNQQTVPELSADLSQHPFAEMRKRRLSTTFCTDNRLVSNTTVTNEIERAAHAFALSDSEVRDILVYGFKRSFFPGTYLEKRAYVRHVIDYCDSVLANPEKPIPD